LRSQDLGIRPFAYRECLMKLYFMLTEEDKEKLAQVYKNLTGKKLRPPERDKAIHLEGKIESPAEIAHLMEQAPNYPIEVQGRE
jgi:hypothetical protein